MTLVDWRWAARNGFWNKAEKKWNSAKGGFQGYLQQRKLSSALGRRPPTDPASAPTAATTRKTIAKPPRLPEPGPSLPSVSGPIADDAARAH